MNNIVLKENYAEIQLNHKAYGRAVALIDVEDVEKVKKHKWNLIVNKKMCTVYVGFCYKSTLTYLHRFVTNCPDDMVVDHINHDTLNNRKENLRVCTIAENNKNRRL